MKIIKYGIIFVFIFGVLNHSLAEDSQTNNIEIHVYLNGNELKTHWTNNLESDELLIAQQIRTVLINSAITNSKINVSDEVLSNCMNIYVLSGGENPSDIVSMVSSKSAIIIDALRKVVLEHQDKDNVYDKYLYKSISRPEWQSWLNSYDTGEKINNLEGLVPHSVNDLKRFSMESLRKDVQLWLLYRQVTKNVSPSSKEIYSLYKKEYPRGIPQFTNVEETVKAAATKQLKETAMTNWWRTQVFNSKISVPQKLTNVVTIVNEPPPVSILPPSIISLLEKNYSD